MKKIIHYAHCIKFTPGCLDREPYSAYELRSAEVYEHPTRDDEGNPEWEIIYQDKVLACENKLRDATAIAAYELMKISRDAACRAASKHSTEVLYGMETSKPNAARGY